jgi:hypothetical protein
VTQGSGWLSGRAGRLGLVFLLVVLAAAAAQAGHVYAGFLRDHRSLWWWPEHDRHAHYLYTLKVATALRDGSVARLGWQLVSAAVWPPLHGLLSGLVLGMGGLDYRLAVLPSLLGWAGSAVLAFLAARRCAPRGGDLAGLLAGAFVLASPSHVGYATDVMLESLGACLTLACLYCYLAAVQDDRPWRYRLLGLSLTALLLHKYNYWLLAVLALVGAEATARGRAYLAWARQALPGLDWRRLARGELRRPLNWLLALLLVVIAAVFLRGPRPLAIGGRALRIYPPGNILNAAYVVLLCRLAWAAWPWGRRLAGLDARLRALVGWHLVPAALFFALPRHLAFFLW